MAPPELEGSVGADAPEAGSALECRPLGHSLAALRARLSEPTSCEQVVALLDPRRDGWAALSELARVAPGGARLTLVWTEEPRDDAWRSALPPGAAVEIFVDRRGAAARAFARGLVATGRARELYLVYPPGTAWERWGESELDLPPRPSEWWHRMGGLVPSHFVPEASDLAARLAGGPLTPSAGR